MKKTIIASASLTMAALAFAGCRHHTLPVQQTTSPLVDGTSMTTQAHETRGVLTGPVMYIHDANGILAQAELRNTTKARTVIKYKFEWFDVNGLQLPSTVEGWMQVQVESLESKAIQAVSPNPNAKKAVLKTM
jgi:uncharacterized protein YcfL